MHAVQFPPPILDESQPMTGFFCTNLGEILGKISTNFSVGSTKTGGGN
jgi:hypothetical protein